MESSDVDRAIWRLVKNNELGVYNLLAGSTWVDHEDARLLVDYFAAVAAKVDANDSVVYGCPCCCNDWDDDENIYEA